MTDPMGVTLGDGGWTYAWSHPRKPHLHPLTTPSGFVLTQVEPEDHPWQRGLWFVVKYVDGHNFWEEYPRSWDPAGYGVQRHVAPPRTVGTGLVGDLDWIGPDRETVALREHREIDTALVDRSAGAYAVDWSSTLVAPRDVVLDRTPHDGTWGGYSGLAFRGRADWTDTRLLLDDGEPTGRVAPQRSRWCDLSSDRAGVCILDHPDNLGHPVDFYASCRAGDGYGGGWANTVYPSFLWHGPKTLPAGEALRLRYRVVVHDGPWTREQAEAAWEAWSV